MSEQDDIVNELVRKKIEMLRSLDHPYEMEIFKLKERIYRMEKEQEYSKLIATMCKHLVSVEDTVYKFYRTDKNLEHSECKEVCSAVNSCLELLEDVE